MTTSALLLAAHGVAPGKDSLKRRITRVLDADLARGPANNTWVALCLVVLVAVAAPLAAFDPTAQRHAAGASDSHPSVLLTARNGSQTLTIGHFPNGHETLTIGGLAPGDGDKSAEDARDRGRERDDEVDAVIASKAVGLTPEYIDAMRAAGFDGSVDDLTGDRAVGVTPEFARQMRQYDPSVDLGTITGARATGMDPAYFSQMRQLFPGLSVDDAVGLRATGVTYDFAQQMRSLFPRVTADQLQGMSAVGVTPAFVGEMRRQGLRADFARPGDPESRGVPRLQRRARRAGDPPGGLNGGGQFGGGEHFDGQLDRAERDRLAAAMDDAACSAGAARPGAARRARRSRTARFAGRLIQPHR